MLMRVILLLCMLLMTAIDVAAQRLINVCDIETKKPLPKVRLWSGTAYNDSTNYMGKCIIPFEIDTLSVSKAGYMPTKIPMSELTDTVMLIPNAHALGEVTVLGTDKARVLNENIKKWMRQDPTEAALQRPANGNLLALAVWLIDKGYHLLFPKHKKEVAVEDMEDPILNAYRETQEQLAKEKAEKERGK